jgi:hypothetical protein
MIGSQVPLDDPEGYRFEGIIDNVMLYNRVLQTTEVEDHYTAIVP